MNKFILISLFLIIIGVSVSAEARVIRFGPHCEYLPNISGGLCCLTGPLGWGGGVADCEADLSAEACKEICEKAKPKKADLSFMNEGIEQ